MVNVSSIPAAQDARELYEFVFRNGVKDPTAEKWLLGAVDVNAQRYAVEACKRLSLECGAMVYDVLFVWRKSTHEQQTANGLHQPIPVVAGIFANDGWPINIVPRELHNKNEQFKGEVQSDLFVAIKEAIMRANLATIINSSRYGLNCVTL